MSVAEQWDDPAVADFERGIETAARVVARTGFDDPEGLRVLADRIDEHAGGEFDRGVAAGYRVIACTLVIEAGLLQLDERR